MEFSDVQEIRKLLLTPNPDSVAAANCKLESLASFVSSAKSALDSGEASNPSLFAFLKDVHQEVARIRNLLEGAANFFNGLSGLQHNAAYRPNGLLIAESPGHRTLAQL